MTEKEQARREKIRNTLKKKYAEDPNYKDRLKQASKTRWSKPGSRESMSRIMKENNPMYDDEFRQKHLAACTSEEYRNRLSEIQKDIWEDPDRRERGIEACRALWANKDIQKRKGDKMRQNNPMFDPKVYEYWETRIGDPEVRQRMAEGQKKSWSLGGHISRPSSWGNIYGKDWDAIKLLTFRRDGYKCAVCKYKGGKLSVHHIVPYVICKSNSDGILITLCSECHTMTERAFYRICERGEFSEAYVGNIPDKVILIQAGWEALRYTETMRKEQRLEADAEATADNASTSPPAAIEFSHSIAV